MTALYKTKVAEYIMLGMQRAGIGSYRALEERSGVPTSTLHSYARGIVANPTEENLLRIAAAFGDPPERIRELKSDAPPPAKESGEQLASLIRTSVLEAMETQARAAAAQQAEIIRHADRRVEEHERRCAERIRAADERCAQRIADQRAHYEEKLADLRAHYEERIAEDTKHRLELRARNNAVRDYLKRTIRNLTLALIAVGFYAVYAFRAFDLQDSTRGLYRGENNVLPAIVVVVVVSLIGWKTVSAAKAYKGDQKGEQP